MENNRNARRLKDDKIPGNQTQTAIPKNQIVLADGSIKTIAGIAEDGSVINQTPKNQILLADGTIKTIPGIAEDGSIIDKDTQTVDSELDEEIPELDNDDKTLMSPEEITNELTLDGTPPAPENVDKFTEFQEATNKKMEAMEAKYQGKIEELQAQLAEAKLPNVPPQALTNEVLDKAQTEVAKEGAQNLQEASTKPGLLAKMFSGIGNVHNTLRNAPPLVKAFLGVGAVGLALLSVAGWAPGILPGGIAYWAPSLAGHALGIKACAAVFAGYLGGIVVSNGDKPEANPVQESSAPQPLASDLETPQPLTAEGEIDRVAENVNAPDVLAGNESMEGKERQAKVICEKLKEFPDQQISFSKNGKDFEISFDSKTNKFTVSKSEGNPTSTDKAENLISSLVKLDDETLNDLERQAMALKAKDESGESDVEGEKEPTIIKISECKKDDTIKVEDSNGKTVELKVVDPEAGTVSVVNSKGEIVTQTVNSLTDDGKNHNGEVITGAFISIEGFGVMKDIKSVTLTPAEGGDVSADKDKPEEKSSETKESIGELKQPFFTATYSKMGALEDAVSNATSKLSLEDIKPFSNEIKETIGLGPEATDEQALEMLNVALALNDTTEAKSINDGIKDRQPGLSKEILAKASEKLSPKLNDKFSGKDTSELVNSVKALAANTDIVKTYIDAKAVKNEAAKGFEVSDAIAGGGSKLLASPNAKQMMVAAGVSPEALALLNGDNKQSVIAYLDGKASLSSDQVKLIKQGINQTLLYLGAETGVPQEPTVIATAEEVAETAEENPNLINAKDITEEKMAEIVAAQGENVHMNITLNDGRVIKNQKLGSKLVSDGSTASNIYIQNRSHGKFLEFTDPQDAINFPDDNVSYPILLSDLASIEVIPQNDTDTADKADDREAVTA